MNQTEEALINGFSDHFTTRYKLQISENNDILPLRKVCEECSSSSHALQILQNRKVLRSLVQTEESHRLSSYALQSTHG